VSICEVCVVVLNKFWRFLISLKDQLHRRNIARISTECIYIYVLEITEFSDLHAGSHGPEILHIVI